MVHQLVVDHSQWWRKWPDTSDWDYSGLTLNPDDYGDLYVVNTLYPIHSAWEDHSCWPVKYPTVYNLDPPPRAVIDKMKRDLYERAAGRQVLRWNHAWQCFPEVMDYVADLFKLTILWHNDDAPGSSESKTFPVAQWFDVVAHAVDIWNMETGERTADKYRELGVPHTYLVGPSPSTGTTWSRTPEKIAAMAAGHLPPFTLVWVGNGGGTTDYRRRQMRQLRQTRFPWPVRLHGYSMPDGFLQPYSESSEARGAAVSGLYADALFGVNIQENSLLNSRLVDLWHAGVAQICHDPWGELAEYDGLFLPWDGDMSHLVDVVQDALKDIPRLVQMVTRAYEMASSRTWGGGAVAPRILREHHVDG